MKFDIFIRYNTKIQEKTFSPFFFELSVIPIFSPAGVNDYLQWCAVRSKKKKNNKRLYSKCFMLLCDIEEAAKKK
jgi:hypothetical protein